MLPPDWRTKPLHHRWASPLPLPVLGGEEGFERALQHGRFDALPVSPTSICQHVVASRHLVSYGGLVELAATRMMVSSPPTGMAIACVDREL